LFDRLIHWRRHIITTAISHGGEKRREEKRGEKEKKKKETCLNGISPSPSLGEIKKERAKEKKYKIKR